MFLQVSSIEVSIQCVSVLSSDTHTHTHILYQSNFEKPFQIRKLNVTSWQTDNKRKAQELLIKKRESVWYLPSMKALTRIIQDMGISSTYLLSLITVKTYGIGIVKTNCESKFMMT